MIIQSIRRRIVAIAVGLVMLMVGTSVLSIVMIGRVGHLLDELTTRYTSANLQLVRVNVGKAVPLDNIAEIVGGSPAS